MISHVKMRYVTKCLTWFNILCFTLLLIAINNLSQVLARGLNENIKTGWGSHLDVLLPLVEFLLLLLPVSQENNTPNAMAKRETLYFQKTEKNEAREWAGDQ